MSASARPTLPSARRPLHGVGLRTKHYATALEGGLPVALVEVISENFIERGGRPRAVLDRVRQDSEVTLHGVSLSLGGVDPLNLAHLAGLRRLAEEIDACWVSDHLCFGTHRGHYGHDLWPLPYTEESLEHVSARIAEVQERLGRQLVIENPSTYVQFATSTLTEWDFIVELCARTGCGVLLDVNNVHVSAYNHGFSALEYIAAIPRGVVRQLHLAGHLDKGSYLLDNHGSAVQPPVWELYRQVVERFGDVPCIVEWDEQVPALEVLLAESEAAARTARQVLGRQVLAAAPLPATALAVEVALR